jgi:hypothetical protein
MVFVLVLTAARLATAATPAHVSLSFEQPIPDANYPELVYWFITPETFAAGRVSEDVHHIASDTPFTFAFLTERNGVLLLKNPQPKGFTPPSCPSWPPWCTLSPATLELMLGRLKSLGRTSQWIEDWPGI